MKKVIILFALKGILIPSIFAQVAKSGINTEIPNSTLTVGGSLGAAYREIHTSTTLTDQDYYVTYNGMLANAIITLPGISTVTNQKFTGRGYKIKNLSGQSITVQTVPGNTIRFRNNLSVNSLIIADGVYAELVCTQDDTNWDLLFISEGENKSTITKVNLKLPRYYGPGEYGVFNTGNDWVLKSVVGAGNYDWQTRYAKMTYEYQGLPVDITGMAAIAIVDSPISILTTCILRLSGGKVIVEINCRQASAGDWTNVGYPVDLFFIKAS
ncbi:hypothetical protein [Flavobacterium lipolyticum]|uniref:Uncharacterized protein n=1 Tax=Flavobacterium lipolyticum TaxID=2893754 RepID=A0ABS8M4E2_9FLAO|nr:hypothetical protein [Flavobacterium sp. F-126]MCC9019549.1 hypothetical protein [Flavobacterium sp. F-126]